MSFYFTVSFKVNYIDHVGKKAQTYFANLEKKYLRKKRELKDANKLGTSTKAYERAERAFNQCQFLNWLDKFA